MATEGLGGGNHPEGLVVGGDEELACSSVGEFVALELAADVGGVFGAEVGGVGAMAIGSLDDYSLCLARGA